MTTSTYNKLVSLGYFGKQEDTAQQVISWLSEAEILRIEPYWRFLGCNPGFSWSKSWDQYSEKIEVQCETWDELLEIALEKSVEEAL